MKSHYDWWKYVKGIVMAYPGRQGVELSGVAVREQEAVRAAIEATERTKSGTSRLDVIRMLHWNKPRTLTLEGAALAIPCARSTAAQWQKEFFEEVARNRGLID